MKRRSFLKTMAAAAMIAVGMKLDTHQPEVDASKYSVLVQARERQAMSDLLKNIEGEMWSVPPIDVNDPNCFKHTNRWATYEA